MKRKLKRKRDESEKKKKKAFVYGPSLYIYESKKPIFFRFQIQDQKAQSKLICIFFQ